MDFVATASPEERLLLALIDRLDRLEERVLGSEARSARRIDDALDPLRTLRPRTTKDPAGAVTGNARDEKFEVYTSITESMRWRYRDCLVRMDHAENVDVLRANGFLVGPYESVEGEDEGHYTHIVCWKGELRDRTSYHTMRMARTASDELLVAREFQP